MFSRYRCGLTIAVLVLLIAAGGCASTPAVPSSTAARAEIAEMEPLSPMEPLQFNQMTGGGATAPEGGAGTQENPQWDFFIAPYIWLMSIDGTVVLHGQNDSIDLETGDFLDDLEAIFEGYGEARYAGFFAAIDATYASLSASSGNHVFNLDLTIIDIRGGVELPREDLGAEPADKSDERPRQMIWDAFVGGRYWDYDARLRQQIGLERYTNDDSRWDVFFGLGMRWDLTRKLTLDLKADYGGFGLGSSAQAAYQFQGGIVYHVSDLFSLHAGYRYLFQNTIDGSGFSKTGSKITLKGPVLGIGFSF